MKNISLTQRRNLADFFREFSVSVISIWGLTSVFDKTVRFEDIIGKLVFSLIVTLILLIISSWILKK